MNLTGELYGTRRNGVSHGDVFTSPRVVGFMLDLAGYTPDKDLSRYRILEPSFGCGDFLIEIQRRIMESARRHGFDAAQAMNGCVYGCEIDKSKYDGCVESLGKVMPDFDSVHLKNQDFLFSEWDTEFDFIVGNPPYVRYENIPEATRTAYKAKFKTFHYRCDLYVLFYEHCLNSLAVNGTHCFICSNRWLKNEYGKKLRALVATKYDLEYIIDVENLDAFRESVLAYPAITLISNKRNYQGTKVATVDRMQDLVLPVTSVLRKIEGMENWNSLFSAKNVNELSTIEAQGFVIGIGMATGADRLFISPNLKGNVEDELLLPIVKAKDLTGNVFNWRGSYLLNPYNSDGTLIDLNRYSRAKHYLEQFRTTLERRHIVRNGRGWYSLIDKVKPGIKSQPKILLPDISGNKMIFVDEGLYYPAHNIYYITGRAKEDLYLLAAILMSDFVRNQVESVSNKMHGGMPRWQSQNIRQIRVPRISDISAENRRSLIDAYRRCRIHDINIIVTDIVRSQLVWVRQSDFPKSLFDSDFSCHGCN